jgi:hypothetical protein
MIKGTKLIIAKSKTQHNRYQNIRLLKIYNFYNIYCLEINQMIIRNNAQNYRK